MKKFTLLACLVLLAVHSALAKITVGASLPDLASIASYIGGDRVDAFSIARSTSDPHSVEVLPSYMVRVSRADIYLKVGLSLDQWADQIIDGARNSKLRVVDCARGITILEKPTGEVDASMGDVHPEGNPHYWLDPRNGAIIAETITEALAVVDPAGESTFKANLAKFQSETTSKVETWKAGASSIPNKTIVTYHSSWAYLCHAFDFAVASKIEPIPGIPPTASHLAELVKVIREGHITSVIQEPYFSDDGANYLARETGIKVLKLAPSCSDTRSESYFDHFDRILDSLRSVKQP
jgi:zinc/manganese transport system substrate-binding protein